MRFSWISCASILIALTSHGMAEAGDDGIGSSWAGVYVGASLGYESVSADWTSATYSVFPNPPVPSTKNAVLDFDNLVLGGFAGYNLVMDRMLLGVEGEIDWTNGSASQHGIPGFYTASSPGFLASDFVGDRISVSSDYEGSLRLRAGYIANSDFMIYATGGLAFKEFERTFYCDGTSASGLSTCAAGPVYQESDQTFTTGWTAGLGAEIHLTENIIGRIEYRYSDYDMSNFTEIYNITTENAAQTQTIMFGLVFRN